MKKIFEFSLEKKNKHIRDSLGASHQLAHGHTASRWQKQASNPAPETSCCSDSWIVSFVHYKTTVEDMD